MAITRERFDAISSRWSAYSSWAVWAPRGGSEPAKAHIGDLDVLDPDTNPDLLATLRPDIILLGLNASSRGTDQELEPFRNFHDPDRHGQDYKLRRVLAGTPWWGAFMTDVIEGYPQTDSKLVARYVRANPNAVREQVDRLETQIADLGVRAPLLVALGASAYEHATEFFGDRHRITRITHYSSAIGPDSYRNEVLAAIAASA